MKLIASAIISLAAFCANAATHTVDLRFAVTPPAALAIGDAVAVTFADGVSYTLNVDAELPSFVGARAFAAHIGDGVCGSSLVMSDTSFTVEVRDISESRLWRACVRDGKATVETVDLSSVRRGGCIEVEAPEPEIGEVETAVNKKSAALLSAVPGNPFDGNVVAPAPVMVDIMLVFDNGARAWAEAKAAYGGSITNFAVVQVAKMNQVLKNTDLHTNFWFRLVDVATVDGRWTKIDNTILPAMRTGVMNASGIWSEIAARREVCGADVVSLIVDTGSAYGTTGIGYITHGTSYNTWVNTYRTWCYSCCAIRSVENDYTLCHEVGHNLGLTHSPTLATWEKVGTFDYSNGYNITNANDGKHYNTIMAYNYDRYFSDYIEIPYFSSPLHYYAGVPVGTAVSNDCTRALRQTCLGIADWHAQTIPLPSDVAFSPSASSAYRISLSTLGGYEIRYTTDGSTPTRESALYESPLILTNGEMTVKAVAVVDSKTLGSVATKTYGAAVELGEYVLLEDTTENDWSMGYWRKIDGSPVYYYFWNNSSDKTAVLDIDGTINVDRDISLGTLVVGGATNMEIAAGDNSLSATNLEVVANATLSGSNYSFERWCLHPESTLVLSPGAGQETTLNKYLSIGASGSALAITNGTLKVTKGANSGDGLSVLQNASVRVDSGGILSLDGGWILGFSNTNPVTVNKGGLIRINKLESTTRPLVLNGGNVEINLAGRAYELRSMSMSVTDDSRISDTTQNGDARVYIMGRDASIKVSDGKTLTVDARTTTTPGGDGASDTTGHGIVKTGKGEIRFLREVTHTGTNTVNAGTFTVAYNSTASGCLHWSIASGATLKIEKGASLQVPSLALSHGSALVLPAASSAPLTVSGAVDLTHVALTLTDADDLSYEATYRLLSSSEDITGLLRAYKSEFPALADGLAWKLYVEGNTLFAKVTTIAEAAEPVVLVSNNPDLVLDIPNVGVSKQGDGVTIGTAPLAVGDLDAKAVAITLDVVVPEGQSDSQQTLCSLYLAGSGGGATIRCVRKPDGTVFCYYYDGNSYSPNDTNTVSLAAGRHTVKVSYRSDGDNCGTLVFIDGEPAYYSKSLKFANYNVRRITIGATAADTPTLPFTGLVVKGVAVVDPLSALPIPGMTASGADVSYDYMVSNNRQPTAVSNLPSIFGLPPSGGFTMDESCIDASFSGSYDTISVSVVASFPTNAHGTIFSIWPRVEDVNSYHTAQAEYLGDGTFAIRYNGYTSFANYPCQGVNAPAVDVEKPHLYTMTYSSDEGVILYQDGVEIVKQTRSFQGKGYKIMYKVDFGRGAWATDNPYPMPNFKVYASHIALGTDEVLASVEPVMETLNFDETYNSMTIAEKLSYLPECQTATGVSAPPHGAKPEVLPVVDILVAFDRGAQAYVANKEMTLEAFAAEQIAKMNAVLATNRLDRYYSYRLAGVCRVDATYTKIDQMSGDLVAGSGPLVALRSNRELLGADTVTLLVDNESDATLGYGCPMGSSTDVASCHDDAFSVCSIRAVHLGSQHTMLHENAHNMGCGHARAQSNPASPFSYGRGYYFDDNGTTRHTIMAYGGDNDASWYFSTSSDEFGFTLGDEANDNARVLRETCGEVAKWREGAAIGLDGVEVEGVAWATSAKYPWSIEGGVLRSYNQTNYMYQCTTPLRATVTGPKVLSFKHKSYFGGESVAGNNYSHFDVLLDDSPVLAQTECTNSWMDAQLDIPEGTHEVTFVFSQRFAMNNPTDNKDVEPDADDAVWLKDMALQDVAVTTELNIPAGTTVNLSDVEENILTITGEGTLVCDAALPTNGYGLTDTAWKGTVAFKNLNNENSAKDFQVEKYGNANSRVQFTNCKIPYLKNNDATFAGTVALVGDSALTINDGYSNNYNVFGALEGDGTMTFLNKPMQWYVFNTATNFTGSINVQHGLYNGTVTQGRRIVFGTTASTNDLPAQPASITVKSGAEAAIGANATWYAYHGVEIAGSLLVRGAGAKMNCDDNAAMGIKLDDGATIRFDSADASLEFAKKPSFASGTVSIMLGDGVVPEKRTLITWTSKPGGSFVLVGHDDWEIVADDGGLALSKKKPTEDKRFDIPNGGGAYIAESDVSEWLAKSDAYAEYMDWNDGATWQDFIAEYAANGHTYWQNFILGYPADESEKKFQAKIEIVDGKIVVTTTEGEMPADIGIVKRLFKKERLDDPWPAAGEAMDGRSETIDASAGSGFYKVDVSVEAK